MIDWSELAARLARLAGDSRPARLLSVTLTLPRRPEPVLAEDGDWFFWQQPERGLRLAGFGRALAVTGAGAGRFAALQAVQRGLSGNWRHAPDEPVPVAFTGFAFSPEGGDPLPNAAFWVPELLLREAGGACSATFSCAADQAGAAPARWRALWEAATARPAARLQHSAQHSAKYPARYSARDGALAEQAFRARGRAALAAIAAGEAGKLVLTRTLRLTAGQPVAAACLLAALADLYPACAVFAFARDGRVFAGASPETLLALAGERVSVDALAGTAWEQAAAALDADKNRREHDFVARDVAQALAQLCADVDAPATPEHMRLNELSHLRRRIGARRPPDVSAFDLIARLHPTPAVGGVPRTAALDWLARHGERRGAWYTGGIGWIDAAGDCNIAVALRCGLFEGGEATLYAGAGFVAGSDIDDELAETDAKLSAMRAALAVVCGRAAAERDVA